jgi:hypothetical protein
VVSGRYRRTRLVNLLTDLEDFLSHRPPRGPHDRRRDRARLERLPSHRGVPVWPGIERWITIEDAELDLLRAASLN